MVWKRSALEIFQKRSGFKTKQNKKMEILFSIAHSPTRKVKKKSKKIENR